jgi:RNA polymerase sigma-70 factor, ECF subfamily
MQTPGTSDGDWRRLRDDIGRLVARRLPGSADVDDVVQEVLIRVWRHGPRLRDQERFASWLGRVVYTASAEHWRSRPRETPTPLAGEAEPAPPEDQPEDAGRLAEVMAQILRPFIAQLAPGYREVVELSELEGISHAAIAQRLSLSVSGVKSRVQRGRRQLRALLERCCRFALDARGAPVACEVRPDGVLPPGCAGEPGLCGPPKRN